MTITVYIYPRRITNMHVWHDYYRVKFFSPNWALHAHCYHSSDNSIEMVESHMNADGIIMHETPPFQYCYHVSDRSEQCAIETETLKQL